MSKIDVESLKEKLSDIVGEPKVIYQEEQLESFARSDIGVGEKPAFIVKPQSLQQIEKLVALAASADLNLVPASSGAPHMKGGTLVDKEGVIVDLSDMQEIKLIDQRNKVGVVEPGVTFEQLKQEADKHNLRVLGPLLPKANKSVLASGLERDPITVPKYHWDMTDPMLCTEIMFGNGRLYRTGSAGGPGSFEEKIGVKQAFKNPLGPGQTDLNRVVQGAQGTLGMVTWASFKMEVKPSIHKLYFVADDKLDRLVDFAYRVLRPKLGDEFFLLNKQSFASMTGKNVAEFPNDKAYVAVYGVSGYEILPEERVAYQEKDIARIAQQVGVDVSNAYMRVSSSKFDQIIAEPSAEPYYKNTVKGACVDIHFLSTMDKSKGFIDVMSSCAEKVGYPVSEIGLYIQPILFGRSCHIEFSLYYDANDDAAAQKVKELHQLASKALFENGAFYSRPYGAWSDLAYSKCNDTVSMLKKLKDIFDPDNVLNRGKLVYKEAM